MKRRYFHVSHGQFYDAAKQTQVENDRKLDAWFAFAKQYDAVPAVTSERCVGIISKDRPQGWIKESITGDGEPVWRPHKIKASADWRQLDSLPLLTALWRVALAHGFKQYVSDRKSVLMTSCQFVDDVLVVIVGQTEESLHRPPAEAKELLEWEFKKWVHEYEQAQEQMRVATVSDRLFPKPDHIVESE